MKKSVIEFLKHLQRLTKNLRKSLEFQRNDPEQAEYIVFLDFV